MTFDIVEFLQQVADLERIRRGLPPGELVFESEEREDLADFRHLLSWPPPQCCDEHPAPQR